MKNGIEYIINDYLTMQTWEVVWSTALEGYIARGSLWTTLTKQDLKDIIEESSICKTVEKATRLLETIETKEEEGN